MTTQRRCITVGHEDEPAFAVGVLYPGADDDNRVSNVPYCRECVEVIGDEFEITELQPAPTPPPEPESVTVPKWALELALMPPLTGPLCNVCTGHSPPWDGHDKNPPCKGYAREVLAKLLEADGQ